MNDVTTAIDVRLAVGHMDAVQCEHMEHGKPRHHHHGPAAYYVTMKCPSCAEFWPLFAVCKPYVDFCASGGILTCTGCRKYHKGADMITVVSNIT